MATEKRFIDVTDALEKLRKAESNMRIVDFLGFKAVDIGCVIQFLESRQTAQAVEVVHGHWKLKFGDEGVHYYCSNCKEESLFDIFGYQEKSKYCPNCGAKMDGDWNA